MKWRAECFDKDEKLLDILETASLVRMFELLHSVFEELRDIRSVHINKIGDDNE